MLEFLGLEAEASQIMVTTLLIAGLIGFALGGNIGNGEKTTNSETRKQAPKSWE